MFADDTNLFLTGNSLTEVEDKLNAELILVETWFKANLLSLNVKKTSYMVFGHLKNRTANILIVSILAPISRVAPTDHFSYLIL